MQGLTIPADLGPERSKVSSCLQLLDVYVFWIGFLFLCLASIDASIFALTEDVSPLFIYVCSKGSNFVFGDARTKAVTDASAVASVELPAPLQRTRQLQVSGIYQPVFQGKSWCL